MTDHTLDKLFLDGLLGDSIQSLLYVPPVAQKIHRKNHKTQTLKKKGRARKHQKSGASARLRVFVRVLLHRLLVRVVVT
jgi:hypothetical protein